METQTEANQDTAGLCGDPSRSESGYGGSLWRPVKFHRGAKEEANQDTAGRCEDP